MPFCPDVAAGLVECMVETPELTGVDDAVGAEMMLHGLDFVLLAHQVADFMAGQAAVMFASFDTIHLPHLARIDLLTVCLALLVGVPDLGVTVTIPVGLRGGRYEAQPPSISIPRRVVISVVFMMWLLFG